MVLAPAHQLTPKEHQEAGCIPHVELEQCKLQVGPISHFSTISQQVELLLASIKPVVAKRAVAIRQDPVPQLQGIKL